MLLASATESRSLFDDPFASQVVETGSAPQSAMRRPTPLRTPDSAASNWSTFSTDSSQSRRNRARIGSVVAWSDLNSPSLSAKRDTFPLSDVLASSTKITANGSAKKNRARAGSNSSTPRHAPLPSESEQFQLGHDEVNAQEASGSNAPITSSSNEGDSTPTPTTIRLASIDLSPSSSKRNVSFAESQQTRQSGTDRGELKQYKDFRNDEDDELGQDRHLLLSSSRESKAASDEDLEGNSYPYFDHDATDDVQTGWNTNFETFERPEKIWMWSSLSLVAALTLVAIFIVSGIIDWPGDGLGDL